jgi:radical SAM protein with 4Fe4S-binding SPASM domain
MKLFLKQSAFLLKGPVHGAIYDRETGSVYPVPAPYIPLVTLLEEDGVPEEELKDSPFFLFLKKGDLLREKGEKAPSPEFVLNSSLKLLWIELTHQCNFRCVHCYAESSPYEGPPTLPPSRIFSLLKEGREIGFPAVQFTGGDPLLHPQVLSFVEEAVSLSYPVVEVYTNGSLLTEEILKKFLLWGVHVALSFYGPDPETHEKITGNKNSFYRVVDAIRYMVEKKIPFRVGVILMEENFRTWEETYNFLLALGVPSDRIGTDWVRPAGRGRKVHGCSVGGEGGFVPLSRLTDGRNLPDGRKDRPYLFLPYPFPTSFRTDGVKVEYNTCYPGEIVVDPHGNLYPCVFTRDTPIGNIRERSLKEALRQREVQELWSLHLGSSPHCEVCEYRYACFDCRAITKNLTGSFYEKPPYCIYNPYTGVREWEKWIEKEGGIERWLSLPVEVPFSPGEEGSPLLTPLMEVILELGFRFPGISLREVSSRIGLLRGEPEEEWYLPVVASYLELILGGVLPPPPAVVL